LSISNLSPFHPPGNGPADKLDRAAVIAVLVVK